MFAKRTFPVRINGYERGTARVVRLAVARPSRGCVGVWWRNPASGRLELRWRPARESRVQSDAEDVAIRAAA
ncbi:MAG: hypothetical protein WAU49_11270 [Steroidobacteraceae bacterium]